MSVICSAKGNYESRSFDELGKVRCVGQHRCRARNGRQTLQ